MRPKHFWRLTVFMLGIVLFVVLPNGVRAQQEIPALLSTGLPVTETPEDIFPNGAILYLRANNVQVLLENLDKFLTSFTPEKALPPAIQPLFANPQPFIAMFGQQAFGQPVTTKDLPNLFGIAFDRPISLAMYPMPPDKGFILSIPLANPTLVTGIVQSVLMPEQVEQGTIGAVTYHRVVPSNPKLPREIFILTSDKAAFFCGSFEVAEMLVNSGNTGTIKADPIIAKGVQKYTTHDLTLIVSPSLFKPQLPMIQEQAAQVLIPAFQQIREGVKQIPPADRLMLDSRLRSQFGIDGLDQLVDYTEAYASGLYKVLLEKGVQFLTNLEGLVLAVDFKDAFQKTSLTLFSQDIRTEDFTRLISVNDLKQALTALPGRKSTIVAVGRAPEAKPSKLFTDILNAIETELQNKGLPADSFLAYKDYYLAKQHYSCLESKVDWTLKSFVTPSAKTDFSQYKTLGDLMKSAWNRLSAGPFLMPLTLMPSVAEGVIEQHFADEAKTITQNEQNYRNMRAKLPFRQPFLALSSRFQQEDAGANLKKLTLERIYTTRRGFFGYQQHELINRKIMFHQKQAGYELLYDGGVDDALLKTLLDPAAHPVPSATLKFLDQAPAGANTVSVFRSRYFVPELLDLLSGFEDVMHREMDGFLANAQKLVDEKGSDEFDAKMLEAKMDIPFLLASLNLDANGKVYATLPGGLYYPRPAVMPKMQELFKDFLAAAANIVGGSASFLSVQPGEVELSSVQSTEALALLVKTVVNNFYDQYMSSPEGMEQLKNTLTHPADFQDHSAEAIFQNPFWKTMQNLDEFPLFGELQRSKRSRTMADMRALGTAIMSYQVDFNFYPKQTELADVQNAGLPPEYYGGMYTDAWETPIQYISDPEGSQFLLISYGKNKAVGFTSSNFDDDLLFLNGEFMAPWDVATEDAYTKLNTALLQAINANAPNFVQVLVDNGADPNVTDEQGQSALSIATNLGYTDIVEILTNVGASDVNAQPEGTPEQPEEQTEQPEEDTTEQAE
jgi:hypothetical protein